MKRAWPLAGALALAACNSTSTTNVIGPSITDEDRPDELFADCMAAFRVGNFDKAGDLAEALVKVDVTSEPPFLSDKSETILFLAAESRYRSGSLERSLELYKQLHEQFPFGRAIEVMPERLWFIGSNWLESPPTYFKGLVVDRDVGIDALGYLVVHFRRHPWADDAWMELAKVHSIEGHHDLAAEAYERLVLHYPDTEFADDALYFAAVEYRDETKEGPYDVESLLRAHSAASRYKNRFGRRGVHFQQAESLLAELEIQVVSSELDVADFYHARGEVLGERIHLANATLKFPNAPGARQASLRLEALGGPPDSIAIDRLIPQTERPWWETARTARPVW